VSCDVSINSLHLTENDIGYFRQPCTAQPAACASSATGKRCVQALADGTLDALVSDHTPVDEDAKTLPFAEAEPGATGLELLLSLALKWGADPGTSDCKRALDSAHPSEPAQHSGRIALVTCRRARGGLLEGGQR
jgi:dihydroorotase